MSSIFSNLSWSPDGSQLVTNNGWVFDLKHPSGGSYAVDAKDNYGLVSTTIFSPDGKYLVTGGERIVLHAPKDGTALKVLDGFANLPEELAFSPDSKLLASLSKEDGTIILWKVP